MDLSTIPAGVSVALYRIVQEVLANVAHHAPRAPTSIRLELAEKLVILVADTTGAVPTPTGEPRKRGFGLLGIQERVTALGGEFHAGPTPDGWQVICRLPLEVRHEPSSRAGNPPSQ